MKKIKTVIIGMGRMGRTRYDAMLRNGGYNVVAICDTNNDNLKGYNIKTFNDWKKCIDESEMDAVFVCTYNNIIPDIVCYSLSKGYAVFSEKPPGRNLKDTLKMQETAKKENSSALKFGFNHRYHNSVIEAKALIESGILG